MNKDGPTGCLFAGVITKVVSKGLPGCDVMFDRHMVHEKMPPGKTGRHLSFGPE